MQNVPVAVHKIAPVLTGGGRTLLTKVGTMEVIKSIGIKLDPTIAQEKELQKLFEAFKAGINWSLNEIEKRYQAFLEQYKPIANPVEGECGGCKTKKLLKLTRNGVEYCVTCGMKQYTEYTVRKEIYGTEDRAVDNDLKGVVEIPNKTHYTMLFSQAYAIWKSYNTWRNKRLHHKESAEDDLHCYPNKVLLTAAWEIESEAKRLKRANPNLIWKRVKAQATKEVFKDYSEKDQKEISRIIEMIHDLRSASKSVHFPQLKECKTVLLGSSFLKFQDGKLYLTLWDKKPKEEIGFFGKEYLKQFFPTMEDDSVYSNLTKKNGQYYLMYPLAIKVEQSNIKDCDTFVFITSPGATAIMGYDLTGKMTSVKFFNTGALLKAKRHFKEKRAEIVRRKSPDEKMRNIRRKKKSIMRRGDMERRYVNTFNHQLTRKMVDYVMEQSENPKILIWDIGNGITQNFGHTLNILKNLWVAVQQQVFLEHKANQFSIPVVTIKYNKCNDLTCSACGAKQKNDAKDAKTITYLIKGIKNFKCEKCKYEVNMLINQANNIRKASVQ